ncbi:MAG: hypothetical protein J5I98_10550 [Phaeodactylibacter sp.]|nr:hypothetical protein [Phaeodactylibacter sp.]
MFNTQRDQLFSLIKSLTKAEKRSFKLYANRFQSGSDSKFIQLFDVIDRLAEYDEAEVLKRLQKVKKRHLPNLKRHLYKQILTSLRLIHIQKNIDIQIREQLDFARILYGKGMYMQSLRMLDRIKKIAVDHHQDLLHLEILEFQKMIEARHITRSRLVENKMEALLEEAAHRSFIAHSNNLFSNFNIQVHGWYIQHGHVNNEEEISAVNEFFGQYRPDELLRNRKLTFFERANLFQAYMWHRYILLDFEGAARYARQWVELFHAQDQVREKDPDLYMRSLYYLLVFLYLCREKDEFARYLQEFQQFEEEYRDLFNDNSRMIAFTYLNLSRLNGRLLDKDFQGGARLIGEIQAELPLYIDYTDVHRILLFHFKFAYLYFCLREFGKALEYLNQIIHLKSGHLRDDLQVNARLLHLICHYELGNFDMLDYLAPAVKRLIDQSSDVSQLPRLTLRFLETLSKLPPLEHAKAFASFHKELRKIMEEPFERKSLNYLDIPAWVEGHLGVVRGERV